MSVIEYMYQIYDSVDIESTKELNSRINLYPQ